MQTNVKKNIGANAPVSKFRAGSIVATIWENEVQKDGNPTKFNTISFERSYKDKNDQWQTTNVLRTNDLPKAILVLSKAYEHLSLTGVEEEA